MERIVVDRTTWWLERNSKIPETQFGFRAGKSTADNLAVLVGKIYTGFDAGEYTITAFLDIKGAFDHVNPDKLLEILLNTGLPTAYCLFFYFLIKQRKLYFVTNNGLTEPESVNSGAGQGLVSAPLLFTLYTADGARHIHSSSKIAEFADDKAIRCRNRSLQYAADALQASLDSYNAYLESLNLQLSPEKTKIVIFTQNEHDPQDITFTIKDVTIKPVAAAKFLGIILDQKLTFDEHFANLLTKINKVFPLIKAMCGTKWGADPSTLLNIYRALIRTKIEYGSHIMNAISSKLFTKLEKIQNKAIRTCMGLRISTPINSMMAEGGEIPLKIRLKDLSDRYVIKSPSITGNPVITTLQTLKESPNKKRSKQFIYKRFPAARSFKDTSQQHNIIHQSKTHPRYTPTYLIYQHPLNVDLSTTATLANMSPRETNETFEKMVTEKYQNFTPIYTDGSKRPGETHVGIAIYNATLGTHLAFKISQQASASTAEALAILKAIELALELQERTVIFSDSKNTLQSLLGLQDTKQRSYLIYKIAAKMIEAQQHELQVHLVWIPGHSGIPGNETADRLAKEAVTNAQRTFTPIPFKDLANNSKERASKITEEKLKEIGKTKGVLYFDHIYKSRKKPWFANFNLPRKVTTTFIRMRLNHYNLNSSLHRKNFISSAECPCGSPEQDLNHIFFECQTYQDQRRTLSNILSKIYDPVPADVIPLLANPSSKIAYILCNYLSKCDLNI